MNKITNILLRHNYIELPKVHGKVSSQEAIATIAMNIAYYGYGLSQEAFKALGKLESVSLVDWWQELETELKRITAADKEMSKHMVYKNFPNEVLDKTAMEYWLPQILIYWGFPKELFAQTEVERPKLAENKKLVVLHLSNDSTLKNILTSYLKSPAAWKKEQFADVLELNSMYNANVGDVVFKENMVALASNLLKNGKQISVNTATDVLRLGAALSDGDHSLKEKVKFKSFKNAWRRMLLNTLENCKNLNEDLARRPEVWKRFLHGLHAADHKKKFPKVNTAIQDLFADKLETFNSKVEKLLIDKDAKVLDLLASRPGEFRRRLVHTIDLFGEKASKAFVKKEVLNGLTTHQVVSLKTYLETKNSRSNRVFPPKGNWSKVQIVEATPVSQKNLDVAIKGLKKVLVERLPKVKVLSPDTKGVKLPSNGGEVSKYNRGTEFKIPDSAKFVRVASYWQATQGTVWFDNGVNFFDKDWKAQGTIAWNCPQYKVGNVMAAAFSGDPLNSRTAEGKATQVIDIYMDDMPKNVRYAVWNILCYSRIKFSQAEEVIACLQWGENRETGKVFEPSRSQLVLPLKGDSLTKYICVVDLQERKLIYLDANLKGNTQSAAQNEATLSKVMPAYMEYIHALPSVHDLFAGSVSADSDIQILYSDKDVDLQECKAYVFKTENEKNKFEQLDINKMISE